MAITMVSSSPSKAFMKSLYKLPMGYMIGGCTVFGRLAGCAP